MVVLIILTVILVTYYEMCNGFFMLYYVFSKLH